MNIFTKWFMFCIMFLLVVGVVSSTNLALTWCKGISYGTVCFNGTTGQNVLTGIKLDYSQLLNVPPGSFSGFINTTQLNATNIGLVGQVPIWNGSGDKFTWINITGGTGPTGPQGIPGINGSQWFVNNSLPPASWGNVSDFYLWSSFGLVYQKNLTGSWNFVANITGPVGAIGPQGPAGSGSGGVNQSLNTTDGVAFNNVTSNNFYGALNWSWLTNVPVFLLASDQRYNDTLAIQNVNSSLRATIDANSTIFALNNASTAGYNAANYVARSVIDQNSTVFTGNNDSVTTYLKGLINANSTTLTGKIDTNNNSVNTWFNLNITNIQTNVSTIFTRQAADNVTLNVNISNANIREAADNVTLSTNITNIILREAADNVTLNVNISNSNIRQAADNVSLTTLANSKALPGSCVSGTAVQNTTTGGVQCVSLSVGANGLNGANGSVWYVNNSLPPSDWGNNSDFYLWNVTGLVYQKNSTGNWNYKANISGAVGATGPQGPAGSAGSYNQSLNTTDGVSFNNVTSNNFYGALNYSFIINSPIFRLAADSLADNTTQAFLIGLKLDASDQRYNETGLFTTEVANRITNDTMLLNAINSNSTIFALNNASTAGYNAANYVARSVIDQNSTTFTLNNDSSSGYNAATYATIVMVNQNSTAFTKNNDSVTTYLKGLINANSTTLTGKIDANNNSVNTWFNLNITNIQTNVSTIFTREAADNVTLSTNITNIILREAANNLSINAWFNINMTNIQTNVSTIFTREAADNATLNTNISAITTVANGALPKAGGTMSGAIYSNNIYNATTAATATYVCILGNPNFCSVAYNGTCTQIRGATSNFTTC